MPALILFRRKWLIACDDLVIPCAVEAVLRFIWLIAVSLVTWSGITECHHDKNTQYFLYCLNGDLCIDLCLSIFISFISSKGSVLEVQKRSFISTVLYLKLGAFLFDCILASFCIWLLGQEISICPERKILIEVTTVCLWVYIFVVLVGIIICYNSLGSIKYFKNGSNVSKFFKKAECIWRLRLKLFCCCADISEEENEYIYLEISSFLASFSQDIDLAPTDILAGLVTLSRKHAIEKRRTSNSEVPFSLHFNQDSMPSWMTPENALYFLRIAKSTYGWLAFFNTFQPWKLCSLIPFTMHCRNICSDSTTSHDDCCLCNLSAVQKITGYTESDILYSTFANSVYEPAFLVVRDSEKKSVIIAIRGTRSFSDLITDIDAEEVSVPNQSFSTSWKCHRGALRSALFLQKKIEDLNILRIAMAENPSYTLVITGHSLGASIAAILSLLLHPEYPNLQCYAFSPLAVLSEDGIQDSLDYIFTVVAGDDIVPRLSAKSCKRLVKELIHSLEETEYPKYKILTKAFWQHLRRHFKKRKLKASFLQAHDNRPVEIDLEVPKKNVRTSEIAFKEAQLYAPGRILYIEETENGCRHTWVTGHYLHNILMSPHIFRDHQPHRIQHLLEKLKSLKDKPM